MKLYKYVGPDDLLELVAPVSKGTSMLSPNGVTKWVQDTGQCVDKENCIIATYIVNYRGIMLIADRHSEHVVCAGGENVLSAGEITFRVSGEEVEVVGVTNQSTGYCPEPETWSVVKEAITAAGLMPPDGFSFEFIFRRCEKCGAINIVKDNWYVCIECDSDIPKKWNIS